MILATNRIKVFSCLCSLYWLILLLFCTIVLQGYNGQWLNVVMSFKLFLIVRFDTLLWLISMWPFPRMSHIVAKLTESTVGNLLMSSFFSLSSSNALNYFSFAFLGDCKDLTYNCTWLLVIIIYFIRRNGVYHHYYIYSS